MGRRRTGLTAVRRSFVPISITKSLPRVVGTRARDHQRGTSRHDPPPDRQLLRPQHFIISSDRARCRSGIRRTYHRNFSCRLHFVVIAGSFVALIRADSDNRYQATILVSNEKDEGAGHRPSS
jgi:hypothetical protein